MNPIPGWTRPAIWPLAALLLATTGPVEPCDSAACLCWAPQTAAEARDSATAVFVGVPVATRDTAETFRDGHGRELFAQLSVVTLAVHSSWKGVETDTVVVRSLRGSCGVTWKIGKPHLVFARRFDGAGLLILPCSRTAAAHAAERDIRELGPAMVHVRGSDGPAPAQSRHADTSRGPSMRDPMLRVFAGWVRSESAFDVKGR